jgi:membrane protease YdiL (CAAX protease family)
MKSIHILYGILIVIALLTLEYILDLSYVSKQLIRIPFMVIIPFYFLKQSKSPILTRVAVFKSTFSDIRISLIAGLVVYVGAIGGYALIYQVSDASLITTTLDSIGVTKQNIIYVGLYLSFVNVLLEEFFFRGFLYMSIEKYNIVAAYLVSSFMFAFFHVGIVSGYFELLIFILLIIGLMIVGAFLIFVNRLGKGLINSYIVHMFADLAMFTIGYYLLFS